jgi:hypothetical protein
VTSRAPLCEHDPVERWIGEAGTKIHCGRCAPPVVPHRRPHLRDYDRGDALASIDKAREKVRSAIRSRGADGRQLAQLLAPIADFNGAVQAGRLGSGESKGRRAIEALRAAAADGPTEVSERLGEAAAAIEAVVG